MFFVIFTNFKADHFSGFEFAYLGVKSFQNGVVVKRMVVRDNLSSPPFALVTYSHVKN